MRDAPERGDRSGEVRQYGRHGPHRPSPERVEVEAKGPAWIPTSACT
jgi:hypothetical protein